MYSNLREALRKYFKNIITIYIATLCVAIFALDYDGQKKRSRNVEYLVSTPVYLS